MASADLRDELTCCICTDMYTDPVTLTCGHSFCQLCISRTWDNQDEREYSCPQCRQRFMVRPELKRTISLGNIVESFQFTHPEEEEKVGIPCTYCDSVVLAAKTCLTCEASLCEKHLQKHSKSPEHVLTEPTSSLGNRKCSVHNKVLKYYCCEDAVCICVSCRLDGEHRGHQVETLNEASEKKKDKLKNILKKMTSEREESEKSLQGLKRQVQGNAARVTKQVTALIKDIKEQLEALEKRVLREISRQEEQVSLRVSDLIRQLEIKKADLSRKMGHIEELCNMMDPVTVLQEEESDKADFWDVERCAIKVHDAGDLDVALISATLDSGLAGIVMGVTRQSRVLEDSDMLLNVKMASDMLLDVNTAGNDVSVSEDLKTVSWSEINQNYPQTAGRFQFPQILSSRSFSSGRHYWEVEGSELGRWGIGMAYPSIDRRGDQSVIGDNNKSWGLGKRFHNHYYIKHGSKLIWLSHPPSCHRFLIFLDYEAGRLSFYELCDPIRHLHTFTAAFTEPLHAVFGVSGDNSWVKI